MVPAVPVVEVKVKDSWRAPHLPSPSPGLLCQEPGRRQVQNLPGVSDAGGPPSKTIHHSQVPISLSVPTTSIPARKSHSHHHMDTHTCTNTLSTHSYNHTSQTGTHIPTTTCTYPKTIPHI